MEPDSEISSTCANDTLESLERMEAPEKITVTGDFNYGLGCVHEPFPFEVTAEYIRADLCTMPGELVEEYLKIADQREVSATVWLGDASLIIGDFLAWAEGKG